MRITWISPATIAREANGRLTSPLASVRTRLLQPLGYLNRPPYEHQILTVTQDALKPEAFELMKADVVVVGKTLIHPVHRELVGKAREHGAHIVFDVCDNYFEQTAYDEACRWTASQANIITCNSEAMQRLVAQYCATPAVVIPEAYEGPRGTAQPPAGGDTLKLLWFGAAENFVFLENWIREFAPFAGCPMLQIVVMTTRDESVARSVQSVNTTRNDLLLIPVEWSQPGLWRAVKECDAVLIPSSPGVFTQTKSANRMVEALWAGRSVLATPLPSYRAFAEWTWQGMKLAEGVRWLMESRANLPARIAQAQEYIEHHFTPHVVGTLWEQVLSGRREQAA